MSLEGHMMLALGEITGMPNKKRCIRDCVISEGGCDEVWHGVRVGLVTVCINSCMISDRAQQPRL